MVKADLRMIDLGRLAYAEALSVQRRVNQAVIEGMESPALLLVEHDPVITISHRRGAADHLLASPQRLAALGIDVQETDRGGDITYHGPGQLVAYPILRLGEHGLNLGRYMRMLEEVVIRTVAGFGVDAVRMEGATGVWVRETAPGGQPSAETCHAKLCAMGVRVRKNVTLHGLALNVTTDLSHFDTIVPCGLAGRRVTSLQRLLGPRTPAMSTVKRELQAALVAALRKGTP